MNEWMDGWTEDETLQNLNNELFTYYVVPRQNACNEMHRNLNPGPIDELLEE